MYSLRMAETMVAHVIILCLLSLALGDGGGSNNFMTLRADCSDPYRVVVTLRTSEPFEGLLYRKVR